MHYQCINYSFFYVTKYDDLFISVVWKWFCLISNTTKLVLQVMFSPLGKYCITWFGYHNHFVGSMKLPPGQVLPPPEFCPPENYPWIISTWKIVPMTITPHEIPAGLLPPRQFPLNNSLWTTAPWTITPMKLLLRQLPQDFFP